MTIASMEGDFVRSSHGHRLVWILKSYGPGNTRGSHACVLSIRYFMPRSHETLRQSTGPVREHMGNHTAYIARTLCWHRISRGRRLSVYNSQTWATNDFVPIEGRLVVFLVLTGRMSHNCLWLGKYNSRVHSTHGPHRTP